jgi:hypothetical protein
MKIRKQPITICLVALAYLIALAASRAEILDFDLPPVDSQDAYGPGQQYLEDGWRFTTFNVPGSPPGGIIRFNPFSLGDLPNNGTVYFGATSGAHPVLDRPDGALFNLTQIDMAFYSLVAIKYSIGFTGIGEMGAVSKVCFRFRYASQALGQFGTLSISVLSGLICEPCTSRTYLPGTTS